MNAGLSDVTACLQSGVASSVCTKKKEEEEQTSLPSCKLEFIIGLDFSSPGTRVPDHHLMRRALSSSKSNVETFAWSAVRRTQIVPGYSGIRKLVEKL